MRSQRIGRGFESHLLHQSDRKGQSTRLTLSCLSNPKHDALSPFVADLRSFYYRNDLFARSFILNMPPEDVISAAAGNHAILVCKGLVRCLQLHL